MSSSMAAKMKQTADAFILSFEGDWELESVMKLRAPECKHTALPASLGQPTLNNDEWAAYFQTFAPLVKHCKMTIKDHTIDVEARRVACYSSMTSKTPVGPFVNEYAWFLTLDEKGEKLVDIKEMMDSVAVGEIRRKLVEGGHLPGQ
ncbi:hypothetical protein MBLNU230_g2551t1 [Neophaeotheca triangularis]